MTGPAIDPHACCDVLVLGAGPAGSAAALAAARRGLRVHLLDAQASAHERPGETLHPGIAPLLHTLGAANALADAARLRHAGVWMVTDQASRFMPYGADADGPWLGYQVCRADFDARLLQTAIAAGVQVTPGLRADDVVLDARARVAGVRTCGGILHARWVIDAAGGSHWMARRLGLPIHRHSRRLTAWWGHVHGDCTALDDAPRFVLDARGWTWMARVALRRYQWTRLSWHEALASSRPDVPAPLAALPNESRTRGADVSWRLVERPAGPGYVLVGDAAAVLDPSSSNGLLRALMTGLHAGHLAADVAVGALSEAAAAQRHSRWLRDSFAAASAALRAQFPGAGTALAPPDGAGRGPTARAQPAA